MEECGFPNPSWYLILSSRCLIEPELVDFLFALSVKIKGDPSLAGFFVDDPTAAVSKSRKSLSDQADAQNAKGNTRKERKSRPQYVLFDMLLEFLWSENIDSATRSCEALLNLTCTPSDYIAEIIVSHTLFCSVLVQKLQTLFSSLPPVISQRDVEEFNEYLFKLQNFENSGVNNFSRRSSKAAVEEDVHGSNTSVNSAASSSMGKHSSEIVEPMNLFWGWIEYCDAAASQSNGIVARGLAKMLFDEFYCNIIGPLLSHKKEKRAYATTVYVTYFVRELKCDLLLDSFIDFLLGDVKAIRETPEEEVHPPQNLSLRYLLISRAKNSTFDICLATLNLFDTLIKKHNEKALVNLVLRNLQVEEVKIPSQIAKRDSVDVNGDAEISAITDKFLDLVPENSRSNEGADGLDCYTYFVDAQQQVLDCYWDCQKWSTTHGQMSKRDSMGMLNQKGTEDPNESVLFENSLEKIEIPDNFQPQYFFEGSFLSMLYNKLEQILDQPHELNLVVTSIFARLAEFPQLTLQHYLLNPNLKLHPRCNTLYRILSQVCSVITLTNNCKPSFIKWYCRLLKT